MEEDKRKNLIHTKKQMNLKQTKKEKRVYKAVGDLNSLHAFKFVACQEITLVGK